MGVRGGGGSIDRFCHTVLSGPIALEQLDVVGKVSLQAWVTCVGTQSCAWL